MDSANPRSWIRKMGQTLSRFFQSGSALLSAGNHKGVSEDTRKKICMLFDILRANPRITVQRLEGLLSQIPKNENILVVHNEEGYNLLQKCVGINHIEMVRWILSRNPDLNRGACSFPLHIACLKGFEECVEELLRHGARIDVEARMCWPGRHSQNCEERVERARSSSATICFGEGETFERSSDKLQSAIFYAMDGDEVQILQLLMGLKEEHSTFFSQKRPMLHVACERGAWNCFKFLLTVRSEEINMCYDEYYPVHHAVLHPTKFLNLLIANHATTTVVTATSQMTLLHMLFLIARKNAEDTLQTCRLLLDNGLRELINAPDSLGNTPLHGLIVRYALEEARYGYHHDYQAWNKWDMMHLVRFLLQNGARPSINQPGNSALAYVLRHVKDWEFRYDLLDMLLQDGGNPNIAGRDGSVPLMVCLVPLINKDPLYHFTHSMKADQPILPNFSKILEKIVMTRLKPMLRDKALIPDFQFGFRDQHSTIDQVCYLNCVRILCKHGANPNCSSRSNLTPLHVLVFTASENIALSREEEKALNFEFIRNLLILLLQYGLDPNVGVSQRTPHIFQGLVEMVKNTRTPSDMNDVYDLTLTLIQYGANPNVRIETSEPTRPHGSQYVRKFCNHVLGYYVHLISRKEEILVDPNQTFARILNLFYMCMDHDQLYTCLRLLFAQHSGHAPGKGSQTLCNIIKDLGSRPRTLKQMCRVSIYNSLNRKPGVFVSKLPLPNVLKEYLVNFEP